MRSSVGAITKVSANPPQAGDGPAVILIGVIPRHKPLYPRFGLAQAGKPIWIRGPYFIVLNCDSE
jgi:hypothetical protein